MIVYIIDINPPELVETANSGSANSGQPKWQNKVSRNGC